MQTFLEEVAQTLLKKHNTELSNICLVLPNRRGGLYLKKYISAYAKKIVWSPVIFSIEDFFVRISGYRKTEVINLIFELYEIHKNIEKDKVQEFDQFIKWAQTMLSDFNEIDMHLLNAQKLYNYLTEVKAIEKWNPDGTTLTKGEQEYLKFFKSMFGYYSNLRANLQKKNEAYQGMIYRLTAENIKQISEGLAWEKIYFIGFNALTPAEETVIGYLTENKIATVIRDVDSYYLMDKKQEAGYFLRKQLKNEGREKFGFIGNFFKETEKTIHIHGVPRKAGQAVLAGKITQQWVEQKKVNNDSNKNEKTLNTAVVLADESLLVPVLNSMPENLNTFNITMGYPLRLTPSFNFMMQVFKLFENASRFRSLENNTAKGFYYPDIIRVLQHPMLAGVADWNRYINKINTSNSVFYNPNQVLALFADDQKSENIFPIVKTIFSVQHPSADQLMEILDQLINIFRDFYTLQKQNDKNINDANIQLEYLYHLALLIHKIKELNKKYKSLGETRTLREIFVLLSSGLRLPFSGEPLQGVQIMGMLETRNLDFEKVILLSANEGILPKSSIGNSFIPYDIQIENNFPSHNQKNAVFAYHFYRLLQRAKEVHIIYNTEANETGGGDLSRFIHQIVSELPLYNSNIRIVEEVENLTAPEKFSDQKIEIAKDGEVFKKLKKKAESGLSPTSLNQYRRCRLQFYFRNIAGLKETEEVEENLEHKTIGSIVHKVLEDLYIPFKNQVLTANAVSAMYPKVEKLMETAFDEIYKKGQVKYGRNRLIFEVIRNFILSFLNFEKKFLEDIQKRGGRLIIKDLEQNVPGEEFVFQLNKPQNFEVKFVGSIDRVDELDGTIRIIDYKTGQVKNSSELQIMDWDDFYEGEKKEKAFQVMMYSWLYKSRDDNKTTPLKSGIFSMRNISNGLMNFGIKPNMYGKPDQLIDEDKLESFEMYLLSILEEMFDENIPFIQTNKAETCRICDYNSICNRCC